MEVGGGKNQKNKGLGANEDLRIHHFEGEPEQKDSDQRSVGPPNWMGHATRL